MTRTSCQEGGLGLGPATRGLNTSIIPVSLRSFVCLSGCSFLMAAMLTAVARGAGSSLLLRGSHGVFIGVFADGKLGFLSRTTSSETPSRSLRHGVRVQPDPCVPVEAVLLAVGDRVGHVNLRYASRMNRAVVVFSKEERYVFFLYNFV